MCLKRIPVMSCAGVFAILDGKNNQVIRAHLDRASGMLRATAVVQLAGLSFAQRIVFLNGTII
jgi:hypothetical protein